MANPLIIHECSRFVTLVVGLIAFLIFRGFVGSTKEASMPIRDAMTRKNSFVPVVNFAKNTINYTLNSKLFLI